MSSFADRGLLITVLDLVRSTGRPQTSAEIAGAVGIPDAYAGIIEDRLEQNRLCGLLERGPDGRWQTTEAGAAAATSAPARRRDLRSAARAPGGPPVPASPVEAPAPRIAASP